MEPLFDNDSYQNFLGLPETDKIKVLHRAYQRFIKVAELQLSYIENWKQSSRGDKKIEHVYVFNIIENYWAKIELALFLGQNKKYANEAAYPLRTSFETFLRFYYFTQQESKIRNEFSLKEILRPCKYLYDSELALGKDGAQYKTLYSYLHQYIPSVPEINTVRQEDLKTFPDVNTLCHFFNEKQGDGLYLFYRVMCEKAHGNVVGVVMNRQSMNQEEYRRGLMQLYQFNKEILVLLDKIYLEARFQKEVESSIKCADKILIKSVS